MISTKELSLLIQSAVKAGSEKCFREGGLLSRELSLSEAYAIYGRTNVDRWIRENLIVAKFCGDGLPRKTISRSDLEAVAFKSNRISYLPVAAR